MKCPLLLDVIEAVVCVPEFSIMSRGSFVKINIASFRLPSKQRFHQYYSFYVQSVIHIQKIFEKTKPWVHMYSSVIKPLLPRQVAGSTRVST